MKVENNRAVLYKRFVFHQCPGADGIEVQGVLSIKVAVPIEHSELITTISLEPEQFAGVVLSMLNGKELSAAR